MKTNMLDLKVYGANEMGRIPTPRNGRIMVFATEDGLMAKHPDGSVLPACPTQPTPDVPSVVGVEFVNLGDYTQLPPPPEGNKAVMARVMGSWVMQIPSGVVFSFADGVPVYYPPSHPDGGAPE